MRFDDTEAELREIIWRASEAWFIGFGENTRLPGDGTRQRTFELNYIIEYFEKAYTESCAEIKANRARIAELEARIKDLEAWDTLARLLK